MGGCIKRKNQVLGVKDFWRIPLYGNYDSRVSRSIWNEEQTTKKIAVGDDF